MGPMGRWFSNDIKYHIVTTETLYKRMSKSIRIKDIAQLAGVSVGTVDRVLHDRGQVSKDSYDKVMEILEKTGYKPNLIARTLGSNKTYRLIAVIPNPDQDEYWKFSSDGIEEAKEEWGQYGVKVDAIYFDLYDSSSFKDKASEAILNAPDGIITAPIFHDEAIEFFGHCKDQNIPFTTFNNSIPETEPIAIIGQDLFQSGRLAAELLHMNHEEGIFATIHVYDDIHSSTHLNEKEEGFKSYFKEKGEQFKVVGLNLNISHSPTLEKELINLIENPNLKGMFITTSKGASTVSAFLEKRSGRKIWIVAYDLLKENKSYLKKGIIDFLINQNSRQQAFMGVNQLVNHLLFRKKVQSQYFFPLEIITRQNLNSFLESEIL